MNALSRSGIIASVLLLGGCASGRPADSDSGRDQLIQAERILRATPVIDGHNDFPSQVLDRGGSLDRVDFARPLPALHTDLQRMRRGHVGAQFWSAYVTADSMHNGALRQALRQIDVVHRMIDRYPELRSASTADDIVRIQRDGDIASLIGVEGGHAIEGSLSTLRTFYQLGVRYMTLTHSLTTDWADSGTDFPRHSGLSPFGEDVVREMNRLGMFVDLSHVSDETMRDVLRVSRAPVIFSHSSARGVTDHPRNAPDDVLEELARNRGVIMVTFVPQFVSEEVRLWGARGDSVAESARRDLSDAAAARARFDEWVRTNPAPSATLADVADHIDHIRSIAGVDHIGVGGDFDGISSVPVGLEDVATYPALFAELLRRGYSEDEIRGIAGLNLLRAMREMEQASARLRGEQGPLLSDMMEEQAARH